MIKVMLVEDELLARMTVRSMIDWGKHGYTICGECSDGSHAIALIPTLKPDIVITDVKMKEVNGDELVRFLYEQYPQIKAIVLSGYDDYPYVRKTLKYHAVDYIIKNDLTPALLLELLKKACELAKVENSSIYISENNMQALRQQFILYLLSGFYHGEAKKIQDRAAELNITFGSNLVVPIILSIEKKDAYDSISDRNALEFSALNVLNELIHEEGTGVAASVDRMLFVLLFSACEVSTAKQQERVGKLVHRSQFCLSKYLHLESNVHVGTISPLKDVDESYFALERKRRNHFVEGTATEAGAEQKIAGSTMLNDADEALILAAFQKNDSALLGTALTRMFAPILDGRVARNDCKKLFYDLIALFLHLCRKYGIPFDSM